MLDLYINIKNRRLELGMSQQELAEAVGYKGKSMISQVEKGLVDLPESMIFKFADALRTTPSYLMGWTDEVGELTTLGKLGESYKKRLFPEPTDERISQAMDFLEAYEKASPEIQTAIQTLLKAQQSEP